MNCKTCNTHIEVTKEDELLGVEKKCAKCGTVNKIEITIRRTK